MFPGASGEKFATRTLNILQLKINGTQKKLDGQSDIINQNNIHVACLQETTLNRYLNMKIKKAIIQFIKTETVPVEGLRSSLNSKHTRSSEGTTRKVKTPVLGIYIQ
ncbi:hypothetical protein TNIN_234541 [Trichonephila inaurata madagascariensis]|uniref:Uncharacterized protein n=1 Tax=Trichonephila inaurata madagascariensis TaxID=2747483 RepID=A0A8X6X3M6_9ARAC|nr:hypothetical protein TNIN_234541 [Trichonephila inaurata madagascariensis]